MEPRTKQTTIVAALVALAAAAAWWTSSRGEPNADSATTVAKTRSEASVKAATVHTEIAADVPIGNAAQATSRELVAASTDSVRVCLRGLHPHAPWTAPLRLVLPPCRDDSDREDLELSAKVDAAGIARFRVRPEALAPDAPSARVMADDPLYRSVWEYNLRLNALPEITIDVVPVGAVHGRVVDGRGTPVPRAPVAAFATHRGVPVNDRLHDTWTTAEGTFVLKPPPEVPMLLVANACGPGEKSMLPALERTTGHVGAITHVPDLVLADADVVEGVVRWSNGEPVVAANVRIGAAGRRFELQASLSTAEQVSVRIDGDAHATSTTTRLTDENGRFMLPCPIGAPAEIVLVDVPGVTMLGTLRDSAARPQRVTFVLPRPTTIRATNGDEPQPDATIELSNGRELAAKDTTALLFLEPLRVRATLDESCSEWVDVGPDLGREEVLLPMRAALTRLTIELSDDQGVVFATAKWNDGRGQSGRQSWRRRDGRAFQIFVDPGRWRLRVDGMRSIDGVGEYVAPVDLVIDVTREPSTLRVPMRRAGVLRVSATNARGLYVPGSCRVIDGAGNDCATNFGAQVSRLNIIEGERGELLPGGPNDSRGLAPGDYDLHLDFVGYGARRERVTIRAGETTEVSVKL